MEEKPGGARPALGEGPVCPEIRGASRIANCEAAKYKDADGERASTIPSWGGPPEW